jgi:hypothetical protein
MCPYPKVARYKGTGSIDDAENFTCVEVIPAEVQLPETLNIPRDESFEAIINFPRGYYNGKGWEILAVVCEGASSTQVTEFRVEGKFQNKGNTCVAAFKTQDLIGIAPGAVVTFTVTAIFDHHGKRIAFEGSDKISVYLAAP